MECVGVGWMEAVDWVCWYSLALDAKYAIYSKTWPEFRIYVDLNPPAFNGAVDEHLLLFIKFYDHNQQQLKFRVFILIYYSSYMGTINVKPSVRPIDLLETLNAMISHPPITPLRIYEVINGSVAVMFACVGGQSGSHRGSEGASWPYFDPLTLCKRWSNRLYSPNRWLGIFCAFSWMCRVSTNFFFILRLLHRHYSVPRGDAHFLCF